MSFKTKITNIVTIHPRLITFDIRLAITTIGDTMRIRNLHQAYPKISSMNKIPLYYQLPNSLYQEYKIDLIE